MTHGAEMEGGVLARIFSESMPYYSEDGEEGLFRRIAEEENACRVYGRVDPSLPMAAQQQALHTVTGEFFEVGTPREEREEPKGLDFPIN